MGTAGRSAFVASLVLGGLGVLAAAEAPTLRVGMDTRTPLGNARFEARDDPGELFEELRSGALDAVVFDSLYFRWRVANDRGFRVAGEPLNRLGYHVGFASRTRPPWRRCRAS